MLSDRQHYKELIDEATLAGARKHKACAVIGLSIRTIQRWQAEAEISADKRPTAHRPAPSNKLTEEERQLIIEGNYSPHKTSFSSKCHLNSNKRIVTFARHRLQIA